MNPSVSVIIPVYNRENKIKIALESLINQSYQNFEAIIIDDGSTDQTAKVIKEYNCSNFRYVYQENSGVSVARNKGIAESKGEYICFLDSDDFYEPTFIEKMWKYIKRLSIG
ncbi:nucleotide-diphospho-sugar transferase [Rhizophagus irregularis]|uniref:Nucleotide-diphospho-sugar transferase n=1 Tax=Rhizophagus irregularis TaxID=588596 RepID=A0A2N0QN12_9GLOM|nr:nucleotide-diphospho-sugar transferase [Rhizophagus irregularis]